MRQRPCSARCALLWGLACFACLELGLDAAIEGWLPWARDPYYAIKAARLLHRVQQAEVRQHHSRDGKLVVMLGSSRTAMGLDGIRVGTDLSRELGQPILVDNFGILGAGPMAELLYFERLLREGARPDLLLVEVLPPLLTGGAEVEHGWLHAERLDAREVGLLEECHAAMGYFRSRQWECRLLPCFYYRFALLSMVAPTFLSADSRLDWARGSDDAGWVPSAVQRLTPEFRRFYEAAVRKQYDPILAHFELNGPACAALRRLVERCRQEEIPLRLVLMPEGSLFEALYSPGAWDQIHAFLAELGLLRPTVAVIDARRWIADEHFLDSHHLLVSGAEIFSQRLCREVLRPFFGARR